MTETEKHEPTAEDAVAVAQAGGGAIKPEHTPETAQPAVERAMREEAAARNVKISDEDVERIAGATITQLKAMGAFDPPAPTQAPAPVDEPAPGAVQPAPEVDAPPVKKTWAERVFHPNER